MREYRLSEKSIEETKIQNSYALYGRNLGYAYTGETWQLDCKNNSKSLHFSLIDWFRYILRGFMIFLSTNKYFFV